MKATEDAISKPATTKLTRISLKSLTFFDTYEQPGTAGTVEVGEKLLRLLLQFDEFESFDDTFESFESFDILQYFNTVKFVTIYRSKKQLLSLLFLVVIEIGMNQSFYISNRYGIGWVETKQVLMSFLVYCRPKTILNLGFVQ